MDSSWEAAWLVRSRQMATSFRFWLALTGYDPRDRSLSHRLYGVYAAVFFTVWGFAVLSLLSSAVTNLFTILDPSEPLRAATRSSLIIMLSWALLSMVSRLRRSPLRFTEEDAALICQTPLSRRAIVMAWFPQSWVQSGLPFWAGAVTFGFAVFEGGLGRSAALSDIPVYALAGLRAWAIILPLHLGLYALTWALGLYCLQPGVKPPRLVFLAPALAGVTAAIWGVGRFTPNISSAFLQAGELFARAGFGAAPFLGGLVEGLLVVALGAWLTWQTAPRASLSRAAWETAGDVGRLATAFGGAGLARQVADRRRLGVEKQPSTLPGTPGAAALVWKQMIQAGRVLNLGDIFAWLGVLGAGLAFGWLEGWGTRLWSTVIWVILTGQQGTHHFRGDLARWAIFRQLPIHSRRILLVEAVLPWAVTVLLTWLGLLLGISGAVEWRGSAAALTPIAAAGAILGAQFDILRQARATLLLVEAAPQESAWGVVVGLGVIAVAAGVVFLLWTGGFPVWVALPAGMLAGAGICAVIWAQAAAWLRKVE